MTKIDGRPGTLIEKTGPGGRPIFRRTADCRQLAEDIRTQAERADGRAPPFRSTASALIFMTAG